MLKHRQKTMRVQLVRYTKSHEQLKLCLFFFVSSMMKDWVLSLQTTLCCLDEKGLCDLLLSSRISLSLSEALSLAQGLSPSLARSLSISLTYTHSLSSFSLSREIESERVTTSHPPPQCSALGRRVGRGDSLRCDATL